MQTAFYLFIYLLFVFPSSRIAWTYCCKWPWQQSNWWSSPLSAGGNLICKITSILFYISYPWTQGIFNSLISATHNMRNSSVKRWEVSAGRLHQTSLLHGLETWDFCRFSISSWISPLKLIITSQYFYNSLIYKSICLWNSRSSTIPSKLQFTVLSMVKYKCSGWYFH